MSNKGDGWIQTKVRTYPSGRKTTTYIARITPPGQKEITKSFQKKGRVNEPGTAAHWLSVQQEEIRKRRWVNPSDRHWTVAEWAVTWLKSLTGIDPETRSLYRRVVDLDIIPSGLGDEPLEEIDNIRMGVWMNELAERKWSKRKLSASTMQGRRTVLAMMFAAAMDAGAYRGGSNPMRRVRAPGAEDLEVEPIDPGELPTPEQVWQLYDAAAVCPHLREQILVTAGTGLRPGELLGLQRKNIRDHEIHVVRQRKFKNPDVVFGKPKTRKARRRVPFGDEVAAAINRHIDAAPYEIGPDDQIFRFGDDGADWRRSTWADHWNRTRRAAGLPTLKFYLLRHYYASVLINGGASPKLVMERMGHSSSKYTLERYARLWHDSEEVTRALSDAGLKRDGNGTIGPEGR
ncbi:site-specific integrase [Nocardia sp. CDC159]|uniref:Site-specific integrase n=1 Tax=Nocardia pulmonis TaxID=2951408 RepID=A0A9X2EG98_9NOCA|nr:MULTISPECIES: site-specific integrase [Nocardia]MCM6777751.1 site-specific integrase [Nocardia pulmonis]MCM6790636.1 site-specific integrase [Nocardia sp. CDC159]